MEVILREHVDNLGKRGEIVKVADGYARNYLLPRKLALLATDGNKKQIEREREKFDAKESEEKKVAEAMSAAVTDPYSASVSPTFRSMITSTPAIRAAAAAATFFSSASLASNFARSRSICFLFASVAASASLRGSR